MIEFKDITLADKDLIQSFTLGSLRRNCDLSFANLCSWIFLYQTKYAVMDNYLLLRFYAGEELAYMMPVGTGDVKPVLEALIKDAEEMGAKLRMLGVRRQAIPRLRRNSSADRSHKSSRVLSSVKKPRDSPVIQ